MQLPGYEGVEQRLTFPEVVRQRIEAERPGVRVSLATAGLYHPADLPRRLALAVRGRPDALFL